MGNTQLTIEQCTEKYNDNDLSQLVKSQKVNIYFNELISNNQHVYRKRKYCVTNTPIMHLISLYYYKTIDVLIDKYPLKLNLKHKNEYGYILFNCNTNGK